MMTVETRNEEQSIVTLKGQPQDNLYALEKAVAKHSGLHLSTGEKDTEPRFVVEKTVQYHMMRGFEMEARYQIAGHFQKANRGGTILSYTIFVDGDAPAFQVALHLFLLFGLSFIVVILTLAPHIAVLDVLAIAVMLSLIVAYIVKAYRGYQGHLRELNLFIKEFVQQAT